MIKNPSKNEIITFAHITAAKKIQKVFRAYQFWKFVKKKIDEKSLK